MATLVEYLDESDILKSSEGCNLTPIGLYYFKSRTGIKGFVA